MTKLRSWILLSKIKSLTSKSAYKEHKFRGNFQWESDRLTVGMEKLFQHTNHPKLDDLVSVCNDVLGDVMFCSAAKISMDSSHNCVDIT